MVLSMETLVASLTVQLKVDDCPRSIEVGSAVKEVTPGAAGGGGAGAACTGGGGGGGGGAFFLQPAANIASVTHKPMVLILRLFNMNEKPPEIFYLDHTGVEFRPAVVSFFNCVPSASIVQICSDPPRVDINTKCLPSGAQLGFSFLPAPEVN
jgi:hypothetical protein